MAWRSMWRQIATAGAGVLNENHCDYFKGDWLTRCLLPGPEAEDETSAQKKNREQKNKRRPKVLSGIVPVNSAKEVAEALLADQNSIMKVQVAKRDPGQKVLQEEVRWSSAKYCDSTRATTRKCEIGIGCGPTLKRQHWWWGSCWLCASRFGLIV